MLLDRDKCFDKDITKYLDKHQNILINKYNLAKPGSSTSTKTNTLTSRHHWAIQQLLKVQPLHHSNAILKKIYLLNG